MSTTHHSSSYIDTVSLKTQDGLDQLARARKIVSRFNKECDVKFRINVCPRLGKNNPNAYLYHGTSHPTIEMKHGVTACLYIFAREYTSYYSKKITCSEIRDVIKMELSRMRA